MTVGFKDFHNPIKGQPASWGIKYLSLQIDEGEFDLDPPYQRDHVWSEDHQKAFVGYWLEGGTVPLIIFRNCGDLKPYEVVDGKQRITAWHRWWKNEIPAILLNGREVWKKDFDETELRFVNSERIQSIVVDASDKEILEIYLKLNSSGIVHTQDELQKVRDMLSQMG